MLIVSLALFVLGPAPVAASQEPGKPAESAPALHSALTPADRLDQAWWKERFEKANERIRHGDVELVFLGDSITQGWENEGHEVWTEFYGKRKALNLGFSGDRTQHVLWRLEHHGLEALAAAPPKLVVVMIGTNNSNGKDNSAEEIGEGIVAVVAKLREKLPRTKVLLLAIFPRNEKPDAQRAKNAAASALAAKVADGTMVHFLDLGAGFLEADGTLPREIMPDFLHLSPEGYGIWAETIEPKVKELLSGR